MAYSASNPPVVEQTTQDSIDNLQSVNLELKRFLDERKNKLSITSPAITEIHTNTVRVKKNQVANDKEFITKRGKPFPKGSLYHIHYTKNLEVYYMTGGEHSERTQLIFRNDIFDNDFDYYNVLNKQSTLFIKSNITLPTEDDYNSGKMTRYFAKKSNDNSSPAFEISADDENSSPLYKYVSLEWYIKGDKDKVSDINAANVLIASKTIPNIGKLIPNFQYYRSDETVNPKQQVMDRLGIVNEQNNTQQETQTQTQTQTQTTSNQAQGAGAMTGPPPGVTTGGAGGAGGY